MFGRVSGVMLMQYLINTPITSLQRIHALAAWVNIECHNER